MFYLWYRKWKQRKQTAAINGIEEPTQQRGPEAVHEKLSEEASGSSVQELGVVSTPIDRGMYM